MPEFSPSSKKDRQFARFVVLANGREKTLTLPAAKAAEFEKLVGRGRFVPTELDMKVISDFDLDARTYPVFLEIEPAQVGIDPVDVKQPPAQIEISKIEHVADLTVTRW